MKFWKRWRPRQLEFPTQARTGQQPVDDLELPPSREVVLGDITVDIRPTWCCGLLVWWGRFEDGSACCQYAVHGTADEAESCARARAADGFVVRGADE